jgi:hypothetical protein
VWWWRWRVLLLCISFQVPSDEQLLLRTARHAQSIIRRHCINTKRACLLACARSLWSLFAAAQADGTQSEPPAAAGGGGSGGARSSLKREASAAASLNVVADGGAAPAAATTTTVGPGGGGGGGGSKRARIEPPPERVSELLRWAGMGCVGMEMEVPSSPKEHVCHACWGVQQ